MASIKYRVEMQPLAGRHVVAFKGPSTGVLMKTVVLNSSAAKILRLHLDGKDIPEIARILSEEYGVSAEKISADAEALFAALPL